MKALDTARAALIVVGGVLLCASGAGAASKTLVAGPIYVDNNDQYTCAATNEGKRTLANVTVEMRRWTGVVLGTTTCVAVDPGGVCPLGPLTSPAQAVAWVICEVGSDQAVKGLRVTLQDIETGATSEASP